VDEKIIAQRIKALRQQRNLTLSELAQTTGFSKGLISKVENNQVSPPIATLSKISKALGVQIGYFFKENESKNPAVLTKKNKGAPVVRDGTKFGYTYEALALDKTDKLMEPFVLTFKTGDEAKEYFQHEGNEFIYMLQGRMRFEIGSESYIVEEGDSLYFDSGLPHKPIVLDEREVKFIAVFCRE